MDSVKTDSIRLNVVLAGYGELGSKLLPALLRSKDINVMGVVEPYQEHKAGIAKTMRNDQGTGTYVRALGAAGDMHDLPVYGRLRSMPKSYKKSADLVIDCSTKGCGEENKAVYESAGLPAIYQSGEPVSIGTLYYPETYREPAVPGSLRIPTCSAIERLRVISGLIGASMSPVSVSGHNYKIKNDDAMIETDYDAAATEIKREYDIDANISRVYLRGSARNGGVYASDTCITLQEEESPSSIRNALSGARNVRIVGQSLLNQESGNRSPDVMIIEESMRVEGKRLTYQALSQPPEVDHPETISAVNLHLGAKRARRV